MKLLEIKDSDIRLSSLYQCRHAVDNAIHIGGAFSATIPMVSLFYGGIIDLDVENPTEVGQDMFVLSKGHAVATLASIYADVGYFDRSVLENSRSISSILNGHPGPVLPGVHIATGPMGQGVGVAQGLAIAGLKAPEFDVYAVTGDGELQEGPVWEAIMYAGFKRLENLCVMVDNNGGQLDNVSALHFPYHNLGGVFENFGWRVMEVDATRYHTVYDALLEYKLGQRDGRPTVIICKSTKGHGGFSDFMNKHKTSISEDVLDQESGFQEKQRSAREKVFCRFFNSLSEQGSVGEEVAAMLQEQTKMMGLEIRFNGSVSGIGNGENGGATASPKSTSEGATATEVRINPGPVRTKKAPVRNKRITYTEASLPKLEKGKPYAAHHVIESAMKVFSRDKRVVSIDSDLASTSGLQAGVGFVDKERALNVGVAEANMMLVGEAFGILGANTWISTFCPFYDWKVLRRVAVGHQERLEVIEEEGWLSEGHGIDLTMVATAADLDTQSNGATHMGNDDVLIMDQAAHVQVINVSCPRLLLAVMKWIMEGNRGLVYMRILRAPSTVIYDDDFTFEPGQAHTVRKSAGEVRAVIVASGRGVYEALEAAEMLESGNLPVDVVDMPTVDEKTILELNESGKKVFVLDQNNGYLWSKFREVLFENEVPLDKQRLIPVNPTVGNGLHFIHSGTYSELAAHYGLDAASLNKKIREVCGS